MANTTIAANSEQRVPTSSRYLKIESTSAPFYIKNEERGINEILLKQNSTVDTEDVGFLFFVNNTDTPIDVVYQVTGLRVDNGDTGAVEIIGKVTVDTIENGVTVSTSVGSVEILPANEFSELADITLSTTTKQLVLAADSNRKEVELFLHSSTDLSEVRVGSTNITDNKGRILKGGAGNVGTMTIKGTDAIYVKKVSGTSPKLSVGVERRV